MRRTNNVKRVSKPRHKQQAEQALQDKIKELQVLKAHSEVEYNNARAAQLKAEGRRELANARHSQAEALAKYMESAGLCGTKRQSIKYC